MCHNMLWEY
ncbi:rCG46610 [Rattus norvegicus]|uniref:RCG46610 n=1 Tax=Rattus norvegicus TaxID=10116 RepID=A6IWV2_RAT|nr:rCG46610 [Rattus norvegicus]